MTDYTKVYDGAAKDTAESLISGADFDVEFDAIETAIATKQDISSLVAAIKAEMLISMYPVGTIYESTASTDPGTFLGGTWTALQGKMLFAEDGTTGYVAGNTGGSKDAALVTHTHGVTGTAASDGIHTHGFDIDDPPGGSAAVPPKPSVGTAGVAFGDGVTYSGGAHTHAVSGTAAAPGGAVSATDKNMPPYLAVYMWERTA